MKKTTQGRKKLEMVKIAKKSNLQVTFSKRRSGLFKKASELCTLCGVEIVIVIFSPANKPFSFGHPNFNSIVSHFLTGTYPMKCSSNYDIAKKKSHLVEAQDGFSSFSSFIVDELNLNLGEINGQLEGERKRGKIFDEMSQNSGKWWESSVDELSLKELDLLKAALEELKINIALARHAYNTILNNVNFETNPSNSLIVGNYASNFANINYNVGFGNGVF